jgi:tetratricopeptide (TPR) repeat protein
VNKNQLALVFSGVILLIALVLFGKTINPEKPNNVPAAEQTSIPPYSIEDQLNRGKKSLPAHQMEPLVTLESQLNRATDSLSRQLACEKLARFWKDSADQHELHVYYLHQGAMLVNSEKNLTFAARQIFNEMRREDDASIRVWKAEKAIELYERAQILQPENDSLKIGLAGCYIFGKGMTGDAGETMKGVQMLLGIVRKDSLNMAAQQLLGIGGVLSTQYDKAIARLELVVARMPDNLEAVSWLADAYAGKGDKVNAVKWYNYSKKLVNNPDFSREVDQRISQLK